MYSLEKNFIGRTIVLTLIFILTAQISFAISYKRKSARKCWEPSHNSVSFTLDNDVENEFWSGITISGMNHYASNRAVRFNLGLGHVPRDYFNDDNVFYRNSRFLNYGDNNETFELRLSAQQMFHPANNRFINFYWGAGPIVTLHQTSTDYDDLYYDPHSGYWLSDYSDETYRSVTLGGIGTIGMEWYLTYNFSVLAEYEFTYQHEWAEAEYEEVSDIDDNLIDVYKCRDQFNFTTSQMKLGVSFHF